jgi:L-histidine N-alpha-methyltransferase
MKEPAHQTETMESVDSVISENILISNFLQEEKESKVLADIIGGLFAEQKSISSRFFYDETGSRLFEEITALPEYYPTRTEKAILSRVAHDIAADHESPDIVELGSGDCSKICILMNAYHERKLERINYYPVDVSETAILKSAEELVSRYPGLSVHGILADFMKHLEVLPGDGNSLICFFGSTLGNLENEPALEFIRQVRDSMKKGDSFLLGLDMVKNKKTLELAYNDGLGVTEAFNKNILKAINGIAGTNFDPLNFKHQALFNAERSRIEMHLEAVKDQTIESPHFSESLVIKQGETIHTENSRKFSHEDIRELANLSGLSIQGIYTDQHEWFSLVHLKCTG